MPKPIRPGTGSIKGRPQKRGPARRLGNTHIRTSIMISKENREYVDMLAAKHWMSNGGVIDEMLTAARLGTPFELSAQVPEFVSRAQRAAEERAKRLKRISNRVKDQNNPPEKQDVVDDGRPIPEV